MFTSCFNNEFFCIFYFYDDERCKMNFPVRDNKVLLYCIVFQIFTQQFDIQYCMNKSISK